MFNVSRETEGTLRYELLFSRKNLMQTGDKVPTWVGGGSLNLPLEDSTCPCLLIGPGTGVAPLRSFIHHRAATGCDDKRTVLFFGCRRSRADCYFAEEYQDMRRFLTVHYAFSRETPERVQYVQNVMREQSEEIWQLLKRGLHVLVIFSQFDRRLCRELSCVRLR